MDKDRNTKGQFGAGNRWGWKPGQSGNPKGKKPKDKALKDIKERYGHAPKAVMAAMLDQIFNGTRRFPEGSAADGILKQMKPSDMLNLLKHFDEQMNGKARIKLEADGLIVFLGEDAEKM